MTQIVPYSLHNSLGYQVSRTARLLERGFETELRRIGLTRLSWCTLLAVENEGLRHPSDIAEFIGIDRTATSRALKGMEEAGLISREKEPKTNGGDGRSKLISVTVKGKDLLRIGTEAARANADKFEAKLSESQLEEFLALLLCLQQDEGSELSHI
ncbi:MarR family winged helix-turn-helix transcriptional regulator [Halocynthiibacter sp. C4]|uniref:MarR family winged helix-turn-helix transcriptional regulator n=1 Tax=Halocynthiibacter sp. C4 TaxID=2992758 RepID=UPI00237B92DA|nr:MarR family winged helix-turn-helix transcriptional regulator [Halocynthiibacter sp. C4]MDE0588996.1 MarR family winged helix-turn-helix transcriptional regulator [Halocynthiibacter sp. C4]